MLDVKLLRNRYEYVLSALQNRGQSITLLADFPALDACRRRILQETEQLKNQRNMENQMVAKRKKAGESVADLITELHEVGKQIKNLDEEIRTIETRMNALMLTIPNIPHESVPIGKTEADSLEVRRWGEQTFFPFVVKAHWDLAQHLHILDFQAAAKVTGSRFVFYKGAGARLERALISFMLDIHTLQHGYEELTPPLIVNRDSLLGTGQLPKFEEDLFQLQGTDYYLIPTAEVPVTNFHRDEILNNEQLPRYYVSFSACFRSEAGAAGRDTRGLIRQHQFNKVELVKLVRPEDSYIELEKLTNDAEKILQLLKLPYRMMSLCTGDLGFSVAKTYDLEVWFPSSGTYREISSCSNFEDFQARRANIRFRRNKNEKPEFLHTLNGSGLSIGRTLAAIIENYQQEDGSILIPEVLIPYMGQMKRISSHS